MDDGFEELVIDIRASTDGFNRDIEGIRATLDRSLVDGFSQAGSRIENSLLAAVRRGSLGFEDLKRIAFSALDSIAAHALQSGISSLFGGSNGGLGGLLGQSIGALFGLPGRATGGQVSPGRAFIVGERGPEVFVPTSSGTVHANAAQGAPRQDVQVAIQLAVPRSMAAPTAMQRSSRQVASVVKRALQYR